MRVIFFIISYLFFVNYASGQSQGSSTEPKNTLTNAPVLILPYQDTINIQSKDLLIYKVTDKDQQNIPYQHINQQTIVLEPSNTDSVYIKTNRINPLLFDKHQNISTSMIDSNLVFRTIQRATDEMPHIVQDEHPLLDISGVYGRSIAIGNNQDMSMDAAFNIQINGYMLDSVRIEAALSDQNLPFQPEGNTQQLQEFDQLYIRISKNRHRLTAGDFWLKAKPSHFLKSHKKTQGFQYELLPSIDSTKTWNHETSTNFSIAKGTITRHEIIAQEGNQGPYKLQGAHGELFFIVIAGSEKIYIDGELLNRGEEEDYVIDYNTAELRFMPRRPITKDSRIHVEFEYQDKNYFNSLIHTSYEAKYKDKWQIGFQLYANQDAKNLPYLQELTPEQKDFLSQSHNDENELFFPSWYEDTLNSAYGISYILKDTIVNGIVYDSILVYEPDSEDKKYRAVFTHFGPNGGNYILSPQIGNGKIYEWVTPINGIPQGEYEAVMPIVTPKQHQLLSIYSNYFIDKDKKINFEWSGSNYNSNSFAPHNIAEQVQHAAKLEYTEKRISKHEEIDQQWQLENKASIQMIAQDFKALEPFRDIEFSRNYNLALLDSIYQNEWLIGFESQIRYKALKRLQLKNYTLSQDFKNWTNNTSLISFSQYKNWALDIQSHALFQEANAYKGRNTFLKPQANLYYIVNEEKESKIGALYNAELFNNQSSHPLAQLNNTQFHELKTYADINLNKVSTSIYYKFRKDMMAASLNKWQDFSQSQELGLEFKLLQTKTQDLNVLATYRWVDYYTDRGENLPDKDENILGRIHYNGRYLKDIFQQNLIVDFGSGQEQKKSFIYIKVPTGQGQYMWVDYNKDGIPQSNEFELALYEDQKEYIRILSPTNEFIKVNYMEFQYQLHFKPAQYLRHKKDANSFVKILSLFSNSLQVHLNNRFQAEEGLKTYNPLYYPENIANLVHRNAFISNQSTFQTKDKKFSLDYILHQNSQDILLLYGLEQNFHLRHQLRSRWQMTRSWRLSLTGSQSDKFFEAEEDILRNHQTFGRSIEPEISFSPNMKFRTELSYKYDDRSHITFDKNFGTQLHQISSENYISSNKIGLFQAKITWIKLNSPEDIEGPLNYIIMEGMHKGHNMIWNLQWERTISNGINFSIYYEGRANQLTPPIHTARVSLRALL